LPPTEAREVRKFGAVALLFFGCLACVSYLVHRTVLTPVFGLFSLMGLAFLLLPAPLSPVYRAWQKAAHALGRAVTAVILTVAYYLVITPAALLKRCFGGRPLPMKPDPDASSYWVSRSEPAQPRERFGKRY